MRTLNRERQRNRKQRPDAENRSDTVMLTAAPFKMWDALKRLYPQEEEIVNVVRIMNSLGVNRNIIAAALGLQEWRTFYGSLEWTEADVKGLLEEYRASRKRYINRQHPYGEAHYETG